MTTIKCHCNNCPNVGEVREYDDGNRFFECKNCGKKVALANAKDAQKMSTVYMDLDMTDDKEEKK